MNTATIVIIIISVAIGFVATILVGLIKLIFFFRHKDSYRHILKYGLLGEVIGLVTILFVWYYYKSEINKWQEPEVIFAIPVYLMFFWTYCWDNCNVFWQKKNQQNLTSDYVQKKNYFTCFCLTIALISYGLWNLYYIKPTEKAKPLIQSFLDKTYDNKFQIVTIEKDYCPDLFHQPWGYKLVLTDTNNIEFGNIFIQFNKYQNDWITYGGIDIEKEYKQAKQK